MEFYEADFIPVIFGNDINVYSVARAFYEMYKVKSYVFGKALEGPCFGSMMIEFTENKMADQKDELMEAVNIFADLHRDKKILVIGCGDNYVKSITQNKENFLNNVVVPYADFEMLNTLMDKEKFYLLCDKHGIEYPKTFVCTMENKDDFDLPFSAPYILKPANGVMYFANRFEGQKKVFKLESGDKLRDTVDKIYKSGYTDNLIIQEFIPGDDTYMRVLTNYSDRQGRVKLMALGHVLLEEHTPYGIGNHAVIINEYNEELMLKFKSFLEDMGFTGFSNFDIKLDSRDGKFKVFEINTRQGRSNFYVTGSGYNIASYFVDDFIKCVPIEERLVKNERLWMVVPYYVAMKYISDSKYRDEIKRLIREEKFANPLYFDADNKLSRLYRLFKSQVGHCFKYRKYMKV